MHTEKASWFSVQQGLHLVERRLVWWRSPAYMSGVNAVTGARDNQFNTTCTDCHSGSETDFTIVMEKASNEGAPGSHWQWRVMPFNCWRFIRFNGKHGWYCSIGVEQKSNLYRGPGVWINSSTKQFQLSNQEFIFWAGVMWTLISLPINITVNESLVV